MSLISARNSDYINTSKISYTSRDYASILSDLVNAIPGVSKVWTTTEESDPGIVLVKLISMLGDMLSFNLDQAALEVYPDTVKQRKNAAQIFKLIGYKMHWYRSATALAYFTNTSTVPVTIPKFTMVTTSDNSIYYTVMEQLELPANSANRGNDYTTTLVQGKVITPQLLTSNRLPEDNNDPWYSVYDYNVDISEFVDNRYYFSYSNIEEANIVLVDNDDNESEQEWTLVENISLSSEAGKLFEFGVDEYDRPYIRIPDYFEQKYPNISRFKLFYILSDGINGEIVDNSLTKITNRIMTQISESKYGDATDDILLFNEASTYGYDPETADEARDEAIDYVNTLDTLITLDDFANAVNRLDGVDRAYVTDCTTDPDTNMSPYAINVYIARTEAATAIETTVENDTSTATDDVFKLDILTYLKSYKCLPLTAQVLLEDQIHMFYWTVSGLLYTTEPIAIDRANDLIVKVNRKIANKFTARYTNFNTEIDYIDVVQTILDIDPIIRYVDLDQIDYTEAARDQNGNDTGYVLETRNRIMRKYGDNDLRDSGFYFVGSYGTIYDKDGIPTVYSVKASGYVTKIDDTDTARDTDYQFKNVDGVTSLYNYETGEIYKDENGYTYQLDTQVRVIKDGIDTGYYVEAQDDGTRKFISDLGEESEYFIGVPETEDDFPEIMGPDDYHTGYHVDNGGHILDDQGNILVDDTGNIIRVSVDKNRLTGKFQQTYPYNNPDTSADPYTYRFTLGKNMDGTPDKTLGDNFVAHPIKPGSLKIYLENGLYLLYDNTSGGIVCTQNKLTGTGTINYDTGEVYFKTNFELSSDLDVNFAKNVVCLARYYNLSPTTFKLDSSCIKKQ